MNNAHNIAKAAERAQELNNHTDVQLIIARAYGTPLHVEMFERMIQKAQAAGYLTPEVERDRRTIGRDLAKYVRDNHPEAFAILSGYCILFKIPEPARVSVDVRKATNETGYLLSVTKTNGNVIPGPKCSNLKTANNVAQWIVDNLK